MVNAQISALSTYLIFLVERSGWGGGAYLKEGAKLSLYNIKLHNFI